MDCDGFRCIKLLDGMGPIPSTKDALCVLPMGASGSRED